MGDQPLTEQDEAIQEEAIRAQFDERAVCRDIAETLAEHLKTSTDPDAQAWSDALAWFAKRIKGGHLSFYAQEDFDRRFGPVDWTYGIGPLAPSDDKETGHGRP